MAHQSTPNPLQSFCGIVRNNSRRGEHPYDQTGTRASVTVTVAEPDWETIETMQKTVMVLKKTTVETERVVVVVATMAEVGNQVEVKIIC
jgi:hypothetical protein